MERDHWRKIDRILQSAMGLEESRRAAFLEQACAGDDILRRQVESLLANAAQESFLETPAVELAAHALKDVTGARPIPAAIGRYRVLRLLGEGGMGSVYEAEQDQPRRIVALKVIRPGFASHEALRRFQQEAEALGRLHHPGIAEIYEASTADTASGPQPYFAMELVRGRPLREYVEEQHPNTRERLALMAKVCDAVEHAHQRGVIHRDLKPGNILVEETGQPKILDFGVARLVGSDSQPTCQTDLGQLIGTLAYMSPEQVTGDPSALDSRSDVYAMGVILYELLARKLPYDIKHKPLHEAVGVIREEEAPRLSTIDRRYRGDIDTVVAKALEKDKTRRYGAAADLAADIRRYVANEPISARPASASYRLQKFARRHRTLVAATGLVFLAMAAAVLVSTWEAVRARQAERIAEEQQQRATEAESRVTKQRDRAIAAEAQAQKERNAALGEKQRADTEGATAAAVNEFLQNDMLAQAGARAQARPGVKPDPDLKVRTALDRAAARIAGKFDRQPEVEAAIRDTIGQAYMDLGLYPEARNQFEQALELHRRGAGPESAQAVKSMGCLGRTMLLQGKYPEAQELLTRAVRIGRRVLGAGHPETLYSMTNLGTVLLSEGKASQAVSIQSQVLKIRQRSLGPEHPSTLSSMHDLAMAYVDEGKYPQAEELYKKTLAARSRVQGSEHPETVMTLSNLASVYSREGKHAQSLAIWTQVLEIRRRTLGPEHPDTVSAMNNLAIGYYFDGKYPQAEELFSHSLEIRRRILGPEHPDALDNMTNLAATYEAEGKYPQAELLDNQALEVNRRVLGTEHPATLNSMHTLGNVYFREQKFDQAQQVFADELAIRRRVSGAEHPATINAMANLGAVYMAQAKRPQAEELMSQTFEIMRRVLGPEHPNTVATMNNLADLYDQLGMYPQAEALHVQVLDIRRRTLRPDHPSILEAMHGLAWTYIADGRYADGVKLLVETIEGERRVLGPDHPETLSSIADAACLYQRQGKYEVAVQYASQALSGRRRALGPGDSDTMDSAADLALSYQSQGKFAESEALAREAVEFDRKKRQDEWQRFRAESLLGASLSGQKKYPEAEPLLLKGYHGMAALQDRMAVSDRYHLDRAREWLVQLYEAWGKPDKALEWRNQ